VTETSRAQGDSVEPDRPSREPRRRQRLAAAAASDRAVRDARLTALVEHYPLVSDKTGAERLRPTAEFSGFRGSRLVASISTHPASPIHVQDQFTLACRTLAALDVESVALLAGDEMALAVTASPDHPSDLSPFVIGLTFGPAGVEPAGTLVPYQLDRNTGTVTWKASRPLRASCTQGLWAEVLGPICLNRTTGAGEAALAELLEQNRLRGNDVLLL
jgi:hypothetical protein